MLRTLRPYRLVYAMFTIFVAAARYATLLVRERISLLRPTEAAWQRAHARTGRAILRTAEHLGGLFVKVGQVLGTRGDAMPEALIAPLRTLHDKVPARPLSSLRGHIERQLGRPLADVFESFDDAAIAAASLAQVHRATLRSGEPVAVKVQYPEARRMFPVDLSTMRFAVRVVRALHRTLDLRVLVDELTEFVALELDFSREAESTERVRAAFDGDSRVEIPRVHRELSSDRLLVMSFIDGIPMTQVDRMRAAGIDIEAAAEQVASVYGAMIFEHGFFHGDPHPGNLLMRRDGTLGLLDFGLAKELPGGFATGVAGMLFRGMAGDGAGALDAAESIGFQFRDRDPERLVGVMRLMLGDYRRANGLRDLIRSNMFARVPSHFTLILRVLVLLNGVSHQLVPGRRLIPLALARALAPLVTAASASPSGDRDSERVGSNVAAGIPVAVAASAPPA